MLITLRELKAKHGLRRYLVVCDRCGWRGVSIILGRCRCEGQREIMKPAGLHALKHMRYGFLKENKSRY